MDLIAMAKEFPDMTVSIRLGDLLHAQEQLIRKSREEERRRMERASGDFDDLIPRMQAKQLLHVDASTLWRWEKEGYISAVRIGTAVYYRRSSIEELLESKTVNG